jgi:hypothetical protein
LTDAAVLLYNTEDSHQGLMNTCIGQKQRLRVTLDFEVFDDFDVQQIDFHKVFDISGDESLTVTVEDLSANVESLWETAYH